MLREGLLIKLERGKEIKKYKWPKKLIYANVK